ncbi:MAG: glycosyltransferase [Clostridia bacterium]|nr:glycosyltransferase [Clostridia bacterium]
MKFAGTVVLYNPEQDILENIQTYLPFLERLYVMDNSTKEYNFLDEIKNIKKVKYISLEGNQGIAKALKVATETAIHDGYDFLLSMDQDSKFPTEDFEYVKKHLENNTISDIGIVGINFADSLIKSNTEDKFETKEVNSLITSGSFLNLKNYKMIDGYDEQLFIDGVDDDICYQLQLKNYKVVILPNIYLNHNLGNRQEVRFFGKKLKILVHSPIRYYYMYRNYHYLKKYRSKEYVQLLKTKANNFDFKHFIKRTILEKNRLKNFKMIKKGIKDGKRGILGPYQERRKSR